MKNSTRASLSKPAIVLAVSMFSMAAYAQDEKATEEVAGDAQAGAGKVAVCVACHGEGGKITTAPIYPELAGQNVDYLISTLLAYRNNLRQGGNAAMMSPQAATLSDQDIFDIAAYYAEQTPAVD